MQYIYIYYQNIYKCNIFKTEGIKEVYVYTIFIFKSSSFKPRFDVKSSRNLEVLNTHSQVLREYITDLY